jgi:fused signal recognition particle receptor
MEQLFKQINVAVQGITDSVDSGTIMALLVILFGVLCILLILLRSRGPSKHESKSMGALLQRVEQLENALGSLREELHETLDSFRDLAADVRGDSRRAKKEPGEGGSGAQGAGGRGSGGAGGGGGGLGAAAPKEVHGAMARGLSKTRTSFLEKLAGFFKGSPRIDQANLDELEELLIASDVGARCASSLVEQVKNSAQGEEQLTQERLRGLLKAGVLSQLVEVPRDHRIYRPSESPLVILVVGVNGVGKTTTVAKLAARYSEQGKKVVMVAADTFRAAAVQQLVEWGKRLGVQVVSGAENAKPGTVVFDGMVAAKEAQADIVLIDTAGRLHTKANLMQELEGVRNSIRKHIPDAPHETVLVLDGVSGQNALVQAREFNEAVRLTGLVITKLDGTPRGGIIVAISQELAVPVFFVGVGEKADDLIPFSRSEFVDALLGEEGAGYAGDLKAYSHGSDGTDSHGLSTGGEGIVTTH